MVIGRLSNLGKKRMTRGVENPRPALPMLAAGGGPLPGAPGQPSASFTLEKSECLASGPSSWHSRA